MQIVIN